MIANEADMQWIVKRIVALHDPDRIYLFGSYARGEPRNGSDLDLVVVGRHKLPYLHRGKAAIAALAAFPWRFDLLFFTPEEINEGLRDPVSFISSVMSHASLLYERVT